MDTSKTTNILIGICLLLSVTLSATGSKRDTLHLRDFASDLRYIPEMQARAADSIYQPGYGEIVEQDLDTLFSRCAAVGYEAMSDQMQHYYEKVLDAIPEDADRLEESRRIRETVERIGGSILRRELDFAEAVALPDNTQEKRNKKISVLYALADKSLANKDISMEMRTLTYLYLKLYLHEQYHAAFLCAERITERLAEISDAEYAVVEKKNILYNIGRLYYDFRDYEHAVPYLKAALNDEPVPRFYNMFNIQSRNALGLYYRQIGELDSSDYYFRSMLESEDSIRMRPMFDCIALSNLATNYRRRGLYHEALELHKGALPFTLKEGDHSFASGIYVGLAECYLETGKVDSCKAMIDSALYHIEQWPWVMSYRSCDLYPVMARYYSSIGDSKRSISYMDSTTVANRRQEDKYSALLILRAKQELFVSEQQRKDAKVAMFRRTAVISVISAGVIFLFLMIVLFFYRKKHQSYRRLVAESREWAKKEPVIVQPSEADATDRALMETINKLIEEEKVYLDPYFDMEALSQRMGVHRNLISKTINTVYNKPFSSFLNECRVRHAIHLLSDPANDHQSLEAISLDAGFATRSTFYRAFKAQTGINPTNYRKNREG